MSINAAQLREGLEAMNLNYTEQQLEQMQEFARLLRHWNRTCNLVAKSQLERLLGAHILDSLTLAPFLRGSRVVDMGSGGGFPGVPLAIMYPDLNFTLLDAKDKKIRFLNQVVRTLALPRTQPVRARAQQHSPAEKADSVVTRAFADIELQLQCCRGWLDNSGVLLALKGPKQERVPARYNYERIELNIPGLSERRFLYKVEGRD